MVFVEIFLCLFFLGATGYLVIKKYNPSTILVLMGIVMLAIAFLLKHFDPTIKIEDPALKYNIDATGNWFIDIFNYIVIKFYETFKGVGFLIMTISGYVAIMNKVKATDAMVYIASKPLKGIKNPYIASVIVIPICTALFLCINSASGLGLLLVATIYPILLNIGVSKPTALSVIVASLIFDMGPASSNTILAAQQCVNDAQIIQNYPNGFGATELFLDYQILTVVCSVIFLMIAYYFTNRYWDKKDKAAGKDIYASAEMGRKPDVPLWFAIFPILPLVILIVLSNPIQTAMFGEVILKISTSMVMIVCALFTAVFMLFYKRSLNVACDAMKGFWNGLGNSFSSVVILTVVAMVFAVGLSSLGFVDLLVNGCEAVNMGPAVVTIVFSFLLLFCAAMMGSGNAAFFAFGPMIPLIAGKFGVPTVSMILPILLLASMGRGISPISAVMVAVCGETKTETMDLAKRNLIPIIGCGIFIILFNFIVFW